MPMTSHTERLVSIRDLLKQNSIDACIIPLSDPHLGEYIPDHWKIISWLTGFTGSTATLVLTETFAGLWTDSRYYIQAEKEIKGSGFVFMKPKPFCKSDYTEWIRENLTTGDKIAFDGRISSIAWFRKLREQLEGLKPLFITDFDPVSCLWSNRPSLPDSPAIPFPVEYAGKDRTSKIAEVRKIMNEKSADYHLLTSPDDIMWLLNIRGSDVHYSPLLLSFALISAHEVFLFADRNKISSVMADELSGDGVIILPYYEVAGMISKVTDGSSLLLTPASTSVALYNSIPGGCKIIEDSSIPSGCKAIKNKTEITNIGKVMVKDGIALARLFRWIEDNRGSIDLTERSVNAKISEFRNQQEGYSGPSFATIAAYNEHAAQPHYSPSPETDTVIGDKGILLIDSGGQYMGGTTDITRTISLGNPTLQQKKDFTLVLKGHINLALAKFSLGTRGYQLDILARRALWENGLDYGHGTGHGVGYCLNVHEGPVNISPAGNKNIIESGMLISNEPALYREGEYGIRTENLMICFEDEETEFGKFLKFDTLSLSYIDRSLIEKSLLDKREIEWINSYHSEVFEKLSPMLNPEEKLWLKDKTEPI